MLLNASFLQAQPKATPPKEHQKGSYVDSLSRYYQQASLPVYMYISTSPDLKPTQLSADDNDKAINEMKPIYLDGHGKHYLRHMDAIHHQSENFAIFADGIAPVSYIYFKEAPHYIKNGKHFYGKNLKVSLATKDEMSGIKELYQALNQTEYTPYSQVLNMDQEGEQNYHFYAVDRVGNVEKPQVFPFIVDLTSPESFHNIIGIASGNIISVSTKIYLTMKDNLSGVAKTFYRLDDEAEKRYEENSNINFAYLPDGEHTLTYYSVDQVNNKETEKSFTFYLDKTAPIMSADVLGDRFIVNDKIYFSGRTKLKLTAVDNKAGIKEVLYSIDGLDYQTYNDPFYLPSKSGMHVVRYYATDNMSNEGTGNRKMKFDEFRHNVSQVYVDLTGPALSYQYLGQKFVKGDSIFINSETQIKLAAIDPESGLQKITYTNKSNSEEQTYEKPFSIAESGTHKINYFGYDNVNNRNIADFVLVVDNEGPEIYSHYSISPNSVENGLEIYPSYVNIFLAATDLQTGYDDIMYSINGAPNVVYKGMLQGFEKNKNYTIKVSAIDKLGNQTETEIIFKTDKF